MGDAIGGIKMSLYENFASIYDLRNYFKSWFVMPGSEYIDDDPEAIGVYEMICVAVWYGDDDPVAVFDNAASIPGFSLCEHRLTLKAANRLVTDYIANKDDIIATAEMENQ